MISLNQPHQTINSKKYIILYSKFFYLSLIKIAVNQILIMERKITYKQRVSEWFYGIEHNACEALIKAPSTVIHFFYFVELTCLFFNQSFYYCYLSISGELKIHTLRFKLNNNESSSAC